MTVNDSMNPQWPARSIVNIQRAALSWDEPSVLALFACYATPTRNQFRIWKSRDTLGMGTQLEKGIIGTALQNRSHKIGPGCERGICDNLLAWRRGMAKDPIPSRYSDSSLTHIHVENVSDRTNENSKFYRDWSNMTCLMYFQ